MEVEVVAGSGKKVTIIENRVKPDDDTSSDTSTRSSETLEEEKVRVIGLIEPVHHPPPPRKRPRKAKAVKRYSYLRIAIFALIMLAGVGIASFYLFRGQDGSTRGNNATQIVSDEAISFTEAPTYIDSPVSNPPTKVPTKEPTPFSVPVPATLPPTDSPTSQPTEKDDSVSSFFAIGDAPYTPDEAEELFVQMDELPATADFLIHVGDIRNGIEGNPCTRAEYENFEYILSRSSVPVFVVPGDNEWQDCPDFDQGVELWHEMFLGLQNRHWEHDLVVRRMSKHPEAFTFTLKGTLYIGLNIVGGLVHNVTEWAERLSTQADWAISLIRQHRATTVIFAHADPGIEHSIFFNRLASFIQVELKNEVPILYLNGDKHQWRYQESFLGQPSWRRITLTGGTTEPPLFVSVDSSKGLDEEWFEYDRGL